MCEEAQGPGPCQELLSTLCGEKDIRGTDPRGVGVAINNQLSLWSHLRPLASLCYLSHWRVPTTEQRARVTLA